MQTLNVSKKTKKTSIGEIPVDWKVMHLGDAIKDIGDGGTPDTKIPEYFNGGIPWATVEDIKFNISSTRQTISGLGLKNSSAKLWPPQTVILTTGATIGKVGLSDFPLATKQGITGIVCDEFCLIPKFLARFFEFKKRFLNRIAQGSTFKEVRAPILKQLLLAIPPLSEQRKIAEILSSIDSVIEKTQSVIDQTQTLKKGLMQELFTRGIPGRHKKFKKTEIGEIPEEWKVVKLSQIVDINPEQLGSNTNNELVIKYLDISGIHETGLMGEVEEYIFKQSPSRARRKVRSGDIIISTVRTYLRAFAFLRDIDDNLIVSTGFAVLRTRNHLDAEFIYQHILHERFVNFLLPRMTGSNYPAVRADDILDYKIGYPSSTDERQAIVLFLCNIDLSGRKQKELLKEIQILKSALTQVLLTGEVRVKI